MVKLKSFVASRVTVNVPLYPLSSEPAIRIELPTVKPWDVDVAVALVEADVTVALLTSVTGVRLIPVFIRKISVLATLDTV